MNDEWRTGRRVVYRLWAHIVLTPKYRRKVMTQRVTDQLGFVFAEVCERYGAELVEYNTDQDHAHLLVSYPPKVALSNLVMGLKTNSSVRIRELGYEEVTRALWGKHFWSPSYAVVSCGGAPLEIIKEYVRNQGKPNRPQGRPRTKR